MSEEEIIEIIIDEAFHVHKSIGPGMLENVYKTCLVHRLRKRGLFVEVEKPVPVFFEDVKMECGYRADLVVENRTYLRFLKIRRGVILNFNSVLLKYGIRRVVNGY